MGIRVFLAVPHMACMPDLDLNSIQHDAILATPYRAQLTSTISPVHSRCCAEGKGFGQQDSNPSMLNNPNF
eukprot:1155224-Pelagomonas_calceolata.AAC.3